MNLHESASRALIAVEQAQAGLRDNNLEVVAHVRATLHAIVDQSDATQLILLLSSVKAMAEVTMERASK